MPDVHVHSLRHMFATYSLAAGVDVRTIFDMVGHASAAFTMDTYIHPDIEAKKKAAIALDVALSRAITSE